MSTRAYHHFPFTTLFRSGAARTSRCTRFLADLGSATRWKNNLGPLPAGSTEAEVRLCSSGGTPNSSSASCQVEKPDGGARSEEHTSELQSLMRNSYVVFCLKHKIKTTRLFTMLPTQ